MLVIFGILIIITCVILALIVLIQNPKGGGLSGTFGGIGNQLMGVKQTTDVLEKGTWIFAAILGILCVLSPAFLPRGAAGSRYDEMYKQLNAPQRQAPAPASTAPATTAPMPAPAAPAGH